MNEKVMPLSSAIRLGAMMKPQISGEFHNAKGTCALGAALDAAGLLTLMDEATVSEESGVFPKEWCIERFVHSCPASATDCGFINPRRLNQTVAHLNDTHLWTRERIADWLELLEPMPEPMLPEIEEALYPAGL